MARWLVACLWRSPFFGGDEPALAERLRALLGPTPVVMRADPLDPGRFGRDRGLDASEVALVGGALAQPARTESGIALPPVPLVRAMRRLALRGSLRPGELEAEVQLAAGAGNDLDWAAPHVAPPIAARWWLTERQLHWLGEASQEVQLHSLSLLAARPHRFGWLCFAMMEEGASLTPEALSRALRLWRGWRSGDASPEPHEQCALGIGILQQLEDADAEVLLDVASRSEGTWPPFLLDAVAKEAEKAGRAALWRESIVRLLDLAASTDASNESRLNAALFAAWRTSSRKLRADDLVSRLSSLAKEPPFSRHLGLQRELRRRGALPGAAAGGGR